MIFLLVPVAAVCAGPIIRVWILTGCMPVPICLRRRDRHRIQVRMFGCDVGVQAREMGIEYLRGIGRIGNERCMYAVSIRLRPHTYPAERGIFESGFSLVLPRVHPS